VIGADGVGILLLDGRIQVGVYAVQPIIGRQGLIPVCGLKKIREFFPRAFLLIVRLKEGFFRNDKLLSDSMARVRKNRKQT
jgi:hypothetical protein